jgi:UrcA family protein
MSIKPAPAAAKAILGCIAAYGTSFAGDRTPVNNHEVTVAIRVSAAGLNLNRSTDAQTFYARLKNAAWVACTRGDRAGLVPVDDVTGCVERSLAGAIQAAKTPTLTRIYMATHAPLDAAAHGMGIAAQVATATSP